MLLIASVLAALGTLAVPTTVSTQQELSDIRMGWPLAFVSQDQSAYEPPFPFRTRIHPPQDHPLGLSVLPFLLDVLFFYAFLLGADRCVRWFVNSSNRGGSS